jgi:hypothetical protein
MPRWLGLGEAGGVVAWLQPLQCNAALTGGVQPCNSQRRARGPHRRFALSWWPSARSARCPSELSWFKLGKLGRALRQFSGKTIARAPEGPARWLANREAPHRCDVLQKGARRGQWAWPWCAGKWFGRLFSQRKARPSWRLVSAEPAGGKVLVASFPLLLHRGRGENQNRIHSLRRCQPWGIHRGIPRSRRRADFVFHW